MIPIWVISLILGVGVSLVTTSAIYFFWKKVKQIKKKTILLCGLEDLIKACTK